ncbi:MAG: glycoside hydrolase family 97 protein [Thalassotalea sp.]|nr:glycoside hydrolase family 97 protein [Thalassotalea sp.]
MNNKPLFTLLILMSLLNVSIAQAKTYLVKSPDGQLELSIDSNKDKTLNYSLNVAGKAVLAQSSAALNIKGLDSNNISVVDVKHSTVNNILTPHVKQKSAEVIEHYNEIVLQLSNQQSISFRVFDQGMAYRFSTSLTGNVEVISEQAAFNFSKNHSVLFPEEEGFISHNENLYTPTTLNDIKPEQLGSLPLLVNVDGIKVVITETGLRDYPGMWVKGSGDTSFNAVFPTDVLKAKDSEILKPKGPDRNQVILERATYLSKTQISKQQAGRHFPWRIFAIGQTDGDLLTNQLSYLLADELKIDPSWIKPGQSAWDWWNASNLHGVDFKAGFNTQTYKHYIDFAARYGLEYLVVDEGWSYLDDVLHVKEELDIKEVIRYGKSKNVDIILWVVWKTLNKNLEGALKEFADWGAAGIKVDFMQRDDQSMVKYYWRVAEVAAKNQLLVDFHGSYKPAGLRRAYPNAITREGVRGAEHNKWGDYITSEYNLTIPFIRQLAGPIDYTPGAMVNSQPNSFRIVFHRPMSQTTRAHQVAMFVVFESPLQMLADSPSNYLREHETTSFISNIPTVWDETLVLSAKISDHIILARRSGDEWFIGAMGNKKNRQFTLDLSFLDSNSQYGLESFADGINANKYAQDYKIQTKTINPNNKLTIKLAKNGGWVARLSKQK